MTAYSELNNVIRPHPPLITQSNDAVSNCRKLSKAVWYWLLPWLSVVREIYGTIPIVRLVDSLYQYPISSVYCQRIEQWYARQIELDDSKPAFTQDILQIVKLVRAE